MLISLIKALVTDSSQVGLHHRCLQLELLPLHPTVPHLGAGSTSDIFFKHTLKKTQTK